MYRLRSPPHIGRARSSLEGSRPGRWSATSPALDPADLAASATDRSTPESGRPAPTPGTARHRRQRIPGATTPAACGTIRHDRLHAPSLPASGAPNRQHREATSLLIVHCSCRTFRFSTTARVAESLLEAPATIPSSFFAEGLPAETGEEVLQFGDCHEALSGRHHRHHDSLPLNQTYPPCIRASGLGENLLPLWPSRPSDNRLSLEHSTPSHPSGRAGWPRCSQQSPCRIRPCSA